MDALNENIKRLIEKVRIANSYRFGRHTEKLEAIDGQLSFFDEADAIYDDTAVEPATEEVLPPRSRRKKSRGQREADLKDFPEEVLVPYSISEEELDAFYGMGNWKRMQDETCKRLRHEPESWTVEIHTIEVYVGTIVSRIFRKFNFHRLVAGSQPTMILDCCGCCDKVKL